MVLHWKNNVSIDSANLLKQIPAFRYLKEPVNSASELYSKYPEGAEQGAFVLVMNQNMFYMYNAKRRVWVEILEGISTENVDNIIATAIEDKLTEYDLPAKATTAIEDKLAEAVEDKLAEMGVEVSITVSAYNALTSEKQQERNYVVVPG
ncbi:MAG: hypothetical protein LBE71_02235 [Dysgonamonadaceae bacterium]|jgi:hypothetical protein|nr:hypothetical protein [Dysgonamonadaceae bacterium]